MSIYNHINTTNNNCQLESALFLDNVGGITQQILLKRIKELRQEMMTALAVAPGSPEEKIVNKACKKLLSKMRTSFEQNIDKFELYCKRNIFIDHARQSTASATVSSSSSSSANKKGTESMEALRSRYLALLEERERKTAELQASLSVEEDMKTALYQLKFSMQTLEAYNVLPLQSSLVTLEQQRASLLSLCARANELTEYLLKLPTAQSTAPISLLAGPMGSTPSNTVLESITVGSLQDMNLLTQRIVEKKQ